MESKISDFALARKILEILCYRSDSEFCDIPIVFGKDGPRHEGGIFYLQENGSIHKTIFSIIFLYMRYCMDLVPDEIKQNVIRFSLALIRDFSCSGEDSPGFNHMHDEEVVAMNLDQNAFVWVIIKDIICPIKRLPLNNIRIIAGKSAIVDTCRYLTKEDVAGSTLPPDEFPFIFMNLGVGSPAIRSAFLLVEAVRAHTEQAGIGEPEAVLRELFSDFFLRDKLISFVKMAFVREEDESNFFATLSILCNSEELERLALSLASKPIKQAQSYTNDTTSTQGNEDNWWFMGLTEKMLEPARSEDWSVYETWKPITEELWSKVETERRLRGLDEVPFELLLRIQSEDFKTDGTQTLQSLLSEDRIW